MRGSVYRIITGLAVLLWMSVIFYFSSQEAEESGRLSGGICDEIVSAANEAFQMNLSEQEVSETARQIEHPLRKTAHMAEYAILGLLCFAFYQDVVQKEKYKYFYAELTAVVYAATDEFHQFFMEGRAARVSDILIDALGALLGLAVLHFVLKFIRKHCERRKYPLQ